MNKEKVEQLGASFGVAVAEATEALAEIVKEALAGNSLTLPLTVAPTTVAESDAEEEPKKAPRKRATRAKKTEAEAPKAEAPKAEAPKAEAPKAEAPKSSVVAGDITVTQLREVGSKLLTAANKAGDNGEKVLSGIVGTIILPNGEPARNLSSVPVTDYSVLMQRIRDAITRYESNPLG